MATVASVDTALRAAVLSATSATLAVEKPLSKMFDVPQGATYIRTLAVPIGQDGDSNTSRTVGHFAVTVCHKLADSLDEDAYIAGDLVTDLAALTPLSFWRGITGVYAINDSPEVALPERVGNVIEYTVTAQLSIKP